VLYQLAVGHYLSRSLALATQLSLADHIAAGTRTAEALAAATEMHAPSLRRVLRLLASAGVFVEATDGSFGLTPLGDLLRADVAGSMKDVVSLFAGVSIQDGWRELEFCVRTGLPGFKKDAPNADAFDVFRADPEAEAIFDRAMAAFTSQTAVAVAAAYDFAKLGTVMDVGGGNGALLIGILTAVPTLRGIVFDRPNVAERARAAIAAAGLSSRLDVAAGSFFEPLPRGPDAYMLKHVIHDWSDRDATAILRRCREAMTEHGTLLIVEGLYPERVDTSQEARGAAMNDVNMLVSAGGRQRSEAELRELLAAGGFALTRIVPTMARVHVIEGAPRRGGSGG
jgi:precorrin-6B methylase 2